MQPDALNLETGELQLAGADVLIGPTTRVEDLGPGFTPYMNHGGHATYRGDATIEGTPFVVVVSFFEDRLERVSLTVDDPAIGGTSWSDYEPERVRAFNDEWVTAHVGATTTWNPSSYPYGGIERELPWGTVGSYLHPQDGAATITIAYEHA
jgi:hypothetical protein